MLLSRGNCRENISENKAKRREELVIMQGLASASDYF